MRSIGIGGSEIAAIMGIDPYSSPYQVYLSKIKGDEDWSNKYTEAGNILEGAIAKFFQKRTGYKIIEASAEDKIYRHPKYEFVIGTPDRKYIVVEGERILECKNTIIRRDEVPMTWFAQLQWYLGLGYDAGAIAWLEHGVDFFYEEYIYDEDMFLFMVEKAEKFWKDHVLKKIPPDPICVDDVLMMHPSHKPAKIIKCGEIVFNHYEKIKKLKDMISAAEEMRTQLEDDVKMCFEDAEGIEFGNRLLFTWKASKPTKKFDVERFKTDNPKIYEQYLTEKEGSRRFLTK